VWRFLHFSICVVVEREKREHSGGELGRIVGNFGYTIRYVTGYGWEKDNRMDDGVSKGLETGYCREETSWGEEAREKGCL